MSVDARLRIFRAVLVCFALGTMPALLWRWEQVAQVPQPFSLAARGLFIVAIAWDVYLLYEALTLRSFDVRWKFGLKLLPRFALTIALALLIDAPAYCRQMLNIEIAHQARADTALDRPVAFRAKQYEREVQYWHFMLDAPVVLVPRMNPERVAFYNNYAVGGRTVIAHLRSTGGCARFTREAASVSLSAYPAIAERAARVTAYCESQSGNIPLAAKQYIAYERGIVDLPLPAFNAIFDAHADGAAPGVIHYLQSRVLATASSRAWMRNRCATQYHESVRSITMTDHWTTQSIAGEKKWRAQWDSLFGDVCAALHAREPYLVDIPHAAPAAARQGRT